MPATLALGIKIDPLDYQGLVHSIARRHLRRGLDFDDLVSAGQIGLIEAIERFDPDRGTRFESYARRRIKGAILDAIYVEGRTIRVPNVYHYAHRGDDEDETDPLTPGRRECVDSAQRVFASTFVGDHSLEESSLAALLEDPRSAPHAIESAEMVAAMVAELPPRDAEVLKRLHGLAGAAEQSPQVVAQALGMTTEQVIDIDDRAQATIRRRMDNLDRPSSLPIQPLEEPTPMSTLSQTTNGHYVPKPSKGHQAAQKKCPSCQQEYGKSGKCFNTKCDLYTNLRPETRRDVKAQTTPARSRPRKPTARPAKPVPTLVPVVPALQLELEAMGMIATKLTGLKSASVERILAWVNGVFGLAE